MAKQKKARTHFTTRAKTPRKPARRTQKEISAAALAKRLRSGYIAEVQEQGPILESTTFVQVPVGYAAKLKGKVPSVNHLTLDVHATKRRASTKEVKWFKEEVIRLFRPVAQQLPQSEFYNLKLWIAAPVYGANGGINKWDASNFIKVAEDALCAAFGFDDSRIKVASAEKLDFPEHHWMFEITKTERP